MEPVTAIPPPPTDARPDFGRLLMDVALQFGATLDLERLLPTVLTRITELIHAERALFALFDEQGRVQRAVVHNLQWDGPHTPLPVSQSLISEVLEKGEAVVVADASRDSEMAARQSVRIHGLRFMVGIPVHGRGRVIGVLYTDSRAGVISDLSAELEMLTAVSRLVGTAVENARLFEEQLFRHRLLGKMVHDFRSPLAGMRALTEMMPMIDDVPAEVVELAGELLIGCDRMERMMENALELSSIDHGHRVPAPRALDLLESVPRHVRQLSTAARQKDVQLVLNLPEVLPTVETVPDQLWIVVDNLLFNAIKHAARNTVVTIEARLRSDAGPPEALARSTGLASALFEREAHLEPSPGALFVEVSVHNFGPPISPQLMARLFTDYTRGGERTGGVRSTGLGLSIVDQCVRHLGGSVWVESSQAQGTWFTFSLPTEVDAGHLPVPNSPLPHTRATVPLTPLTTVQTARAIARSNDSSLGLDAEPTSSDRMPDES